MNKDQEYILCAAIHYKGAKIPHQPKNIRSGIVVCGLRHHNCIMIASLMNMKVKEGDIQGFLTSQDRFVDRIEGLSIAKAADQIKHKTGRDNELYSDDMY